MKEYRNLRAHIRKRKKGDPVVYYVYDMRQYGRKDIPLGTNREEALRKWRELDVETRTLIDAQFYALPKWARNLYHGARDRDRANGRMLTLTKKEFIACINAAERCAVTGLEFEFGGSRNPFSPSIDRIDSSKGYQRGNVRIVVLAANLAMSNWGDEILKKMGVKSVPQTPPAVYEAQEA